MLTLTDVRGLIDQGTDQEVLSLYLQVDNALQENQASNPAWRIWLKKHLRALDTGNHPGWPAIQERAEAFFADYIPSGKGLAAFFGPDWEQVYALPVPLENQAAFGKPMVGPLLWALDEYKPYLVVQVDQEEAHFYISYLGQTEFRDSMEIDLEEYDFGQKTGMPSTAARAGGHHGVQVNQRDRFEDMIQEHRMRFFREVADNARQLIEHDRIPRLILGGDEQTAHIVRKELPETLHKHLVAVTSIPRHFSPHEIFAQVQPLALEYERQQEIELVDSVIDSARAGGRAMLGPEAIEAALERGQVSALILAWPLADYELAERLAYKTLQLNGEILMVHGEPAARLSEEAGGVAARLYYSL
jgi:hypothetical protein